MIKFESDEPKAIANLKKYQVSFEEELLRVMSHGVLHLIGYNDKAEAEELIMRKKEDEKIKMFHVKL